MSESLLRPWFVPPFLVVDNTRARARAAVPDCRDVVRDRQEGNGRGKALAKSLEEMEPT